MRAYADLLRTPYAGRLLGGTLLGRLPNGMGPLAIVIYVRDQGGGYPLAGLLAAVYGLAMSAGQPVLGRLMDRAGQPRVLLSSAWLAAAGFAALAVAGIAPVALAFGAVVIAGFATPPLEAGLRALWPAVLPDARQADVRQADVRQADVRQADVRQADVRQADARHADVRRADARQADVGPGAAGQGLQAAYALDAASQELLFTCGPLMVVAAAAASPAAALLLTGALGVAGTLVVATARPARRWRSEPRDAGWAGALRSPGLRVLLAGLACAGSAVGVFSVAVVAYAERAGGRGLSGLLMAAMAAGALAGGVVYGARPWPGRPDRRLLRLLAALAAGYLPLALAPGALPLMLALAFLSGIFLAPMLACSFTIVDGLAPRGTVTEAFAWVVAAFGAGVALGSAVAGLGQDLAGVPGAFAGAGAGGALALAVCLSGRRTLVTGPPLSWAT